jgi:hypothetical protein
MEIVALLIGAALVAVVGIRIGILVAPRLERLGAPRQADDADVRPDDKP